MCYSSKGGVKNELLKQSGKSVKERTFAWVIVWVVALLPLLGRPKLSLRYAPIQKPAASRESGVGIMEQATAADKAAAKPELRKMIAYDNFECLKSLGRQDVHLTSVDSR